MNAPSPTTITIAAPADASEWNQRLQSYYQLRDADEQDTASGDLRRVYDQHASVCRTIASEFGCEAEQVKDPEGSSRFRASFEQVTAAEEAHYQRFTLQRWAAAELLILTPTPTVAALQTKLTIAKEEDEPEIEGKSILEIVTEDVARLAERDGFNSLLTVAEAWIDRWRALGGTFALSFDMDGTERGVVRGIPMSYTWEPTPDDEQNPALRPHEWISRREDFDGAHKLLESLLTLVPGLSGAIFTVAERDGLIIGREA